MGRVKIIYILVSLAVLKDFSRALAVGVDSLFPEEHNRSAWDRGCEDWPVNIATTSSGVAPNPEMLIEKGPTSFRALARMILTPERGESVEALASSVEALLSQGSTYDRWVLPGINEKPDGGRYFVTVDSLQAKELFALRRYVLSGPYNFKILWFEREGYSSIEFRKDLALPPTCELFQESPAKNKAIVKISRFVFRMTPRADLLKMMMAEVWVLTHSQNVELRLRLVVQASAQVHSFLPEALIRSELNSRGRRIFENFRDLRRLNAQAKPH